MSRWIERLFFCEDYSPFGGFSRDCHASRLFAYVSGNDVNLDLVANYLDRRRFDVVEDPRRAVACLIDLNHLPFGRERAGLLAVLPLLRCPAALHSFLVPPEIEVVCRQQGIRIVPRLLARVVRWLLKRAERAGDDMVTT
jgi:hypothetical protein